MWMNDYLKKCRKMPFLCLKTYKNTPFLRKQVDKKDICF